MGDTLKEIFDSFTSRIKSPILGSIIIAVIVINWKAFFVLLSKEKPLAEKFNYFDSNTDCVTLFFLPVLIGTLFALLKPIIDLFGTWAVAKPVTARKLLTLKEQKTVQDAKDRLNKEERASLADRIESIKELQTQINEVDDDQIRASLIRQLNAITGKNSFSISDLPSAPSTEFFLSDPLTDLKKAKELGKSQDKRILVFIYDDEHPSRSRLDYSLGNFMKYQTTKKLVNDNFVVVLGPSSDNQLKTLVPSDEPLEKCFLVLLDGDGNHIISETIYANPDEGMKRIKSLIDNPPPPMPYSTWHERNKNV